MTSCVYYIEPHPTSLQTRLTLMNQILCQLTEKKWDIWNLLVIGGATKPPRPLPNASKPWTSTILRAPPKSLPKLRTLAAWTPCQKPRNPMRRKYETWESKIMFREMVVSSAQNKLARCFGYKHPVWSKILQTSTFFKLSVYSKLCNELLNWGSRIGFPVIVVALWMISDIEGN